MSTNDNKTAEQHDERAAWMDRTLIDITKECGIDGAPLARLAHIIGAPHLELFKKLTTPISQMLPEHPSFDAMEHQGLLGYDKSGDAIFGTDPVARARATAPQATKRDERAALHAEIDRLRNDLAAAKQDAATAWERHAMANRISTQLQDARAAVPQAEQRMSDAEDAARYRWLRAFYKRVVAMREDGTDFDMIAIGEINDDVEAPALDAAIDAARKGASE